MNIKTRKRIVCLIVVLLVMLTSCAMQRGEIENDKNNSVIIQNESITETSSDKNTEPKSETSFENKTETSKTESNANSDSVVKDTSSFPKETASSEIKTAASSEDSSLDNDSTISYQIRTYGRSNRHGVLPVCWFFSENGFVDWAKNCVVNGEDWSGHEKLINFLRKQKKILKPIMRNKALEYLTGQAYYEEDGYKGGYYFRYSTSEDLRLTFSFSCLGNDEITEDFVKSKYDSPKYIITAAEEDCKWGKFFLMDDTEYDKFSVVFKVDEYLVRVTAYGEGAEYEWKPEYFDYFDFETVSLE